MSINTEQFAAANSAFDNMRKSLQQMIEMAQAKLASTTTGTIRAAKKVSGK